MKKGANCFHSAHPFMKVASNFFNFLHGLVIDPQELILSAYSTSFFGINGVKLVDLGIGEKDSQNPTLQNNAASSEHYT